jgi:hypothetical protein
MAIHSPTIDPNKLIPGNETVYVTNYWDFDLNFFTNQYGSFFPKNLSTLLTGKFSSGVPEIKMIPGSFVGIMTKKEYDELLQFTKQQIAQLFIQNSEFTPFGRILVPSIGPIIFENLNIKNVIKSLFGPYSIFLPKIVSVRAADRLNDLFVTYCQFNRTFVLEVVACGKCLPYEAKFMSDVDVFFENKTMLDPIFVHNYATQYFSNIKLAKSKLSTIVRSKVPDCDICISYVVYCDEPEDNIFSEPAILRTKGLVLEKFATYDDYDENNPNIKFFRTLKEAKKYFDETINNTNSKWLCLPKIRAAMGPDIEYECKELLEPCAIEYRNENEDIVLYDSQEECEENCGKLWYCIDNECVKRFISDPEVNDLTGYDSETECLEQSSCKEPSTEATSTTPTPTPGLDL